jgi:hypothetical protein
MKLSRSWWGVLFRLYSILIHGFDELVVEFVVLDFVNVDEVLEFLVGHRCNFEFSQSMVDYGYLKIIY